MREKNRVVISRVKKIYIGYVINESGYEVNFSFRLYGYKESVICLVGDLCLEQFDCLLKDIQRVIGNDEDGVATFFPQKECESLLLCHDINHDGDCYALFNSVNDALYFDRSKS